MTVLPARLLALMLLVGPGLGVTPAYSGALATRESVEEARVALDMPSAFVTVRIAGLDVAIWRPDISDGGRLPLIVFSAGFTACNTASSFLAAALARAGYIVAAPEHRDSACAGGGGEAPEAPFGKPQAWSDKTYRQRGRDIAAVIDALKSDAQWSPRIDTNRIGLMGHSLGGYTVLGLAGAWPSWTRRDVKAVLALAPLIGPLLRKGKLENIAVPVMYQAGARDGGTSALIRRGGGAYDRTRAAYFVELKGANHFAWTDSAHTSHAPIVSYALAFFEAHLKALPFARPRTDKGDVVHFKMK